jgi:glc operon protein GlcG
MKPKDIALFFLAASSALAVAQNRNDPAPVPQAIDLVTAKKLVAAAEQTARAANAKVGIAVVDADGDVVLHERLDGATARGLASSEGKARAALLFGVPTKQIKDAALAGKPLEAHVTITPAGAHEITINQGGLPIVKDGKIIGGIGVGGSASSEDERFAQAGLDALQAK